MGAGLLGWNQLVAEIGKELGAPDTADFLVLAQVFSSKPSGRNRLIKMLQKYLDVDLEPTSAHKLIAKLPVSTYLTTNYDRLLDDALRREKGDITPICFNSAIPYQSAQKVKYFKLHGDIKLPNTIVLTKADYRDFLRKNASIRNELKHLFATKVFLFVGYSHRDPDIDSLMDDVIFELGEHKPPIYSTHFNCSPFEEECFNARGINVINIPAEENDREKKFCDFLTNLCHLDEVRGVTYKGLNHMASVFWGIGDPTCLVVMSILEGSQYLWRKEGLSLREISEILKIPMDKNLSNSINRPIASGLIKKSLVEPDGHVVFMLTSKWKDFIKEIGIDRILKKHFERIAQVR